MLRNENTQLNYCACTSLLGKCRLSLYSIQVAQPATTSAGFLLMKGLGVKLLPPGWDVSPSQGFNPQHFIWGFPPSSLPLPVPISVYSCPRTQHNDPARSETQTSQPRVQFTIPCATPPLWIMQMMVWTRSTVNWEVQNHTR